MDQSAPAHDGTGVRGADRIRTGGGFRGNARASRLSGSLDAVHAPKTGLLLVRGHRAFRLDEAEARRLALFLNED